MVWNLYKKTRKGLENRGLKDQKHGLRSKRGQHQPDLGRGEQEIGGGRGNKRLEETTKGHTMLFFFEVKGGERGKPRQLAGLEAGKKTIVIANGGRDGELRGFSFHPRT